MMLTATLTWPGKITATGITLTNREPMLALCRALVSAGHADQPMTVIDAATGRPVMHIQSIAKALMLTVDESGGCRFSRWKPFPGVRGAPGVGSGGAGIGARGPRQMRSWTPSNGPAAALALIRQSDKRWHGLTV
jgi:hypothetical protein